MSEAAALEGTTVVLAGEIDIAVADQVQSAIERAVELREDLLELDLSALTFIDSAGLGLIAGEAGRVGTVRLLRPPPGIARVVELAGLGSVVEIIRT